MMPISYTTATIVMEPKRYVVSMKRELPWSFTPSTPNRGMTINGVVWRGAQSVQELVGRQTLQLTLEDDAVLVECVFWEQGRTFEIARLELTCTDLIGTTVRVGIRGIVVDPETGHEVGAEGVLEATLHVRVQGGA
jgi:hypothetical protein